jgi:hypothetical protein
LNSFKVTVLKSVPLICEMSVSTAARRKTAKQQDERERRDRDRRDVPKSS